MEAIRKTVCFFARVKTPEVLKQRQWYANDIKILQELGFQVVVATKFNEIPFNCDLYFSWFATGSILPLIKAKISRKPIIIIAGGDEVVISSYGYFSRDWFKRLIVRICLSYADAVLAVSESVLKDVKYLSARNPGLVYNAIDIDTFKPDSSKKDIIVSCAQLDHHNYIGKRVEVLLKSIPYVIDQFPEQKFFIIGEKKDAYSKVEKLIEKSGCRENINLIGAVPNSTVREYLNRAQVCVQLTRNETFGFTIAEAMSCGVPVITSRVGAVPEVVGDCGIYVDTNNPVELSDKIIYLLKNRKVRDTLGKKARERIERLFPVSIRRDRLKAIIEKII